MSFPKSKNKVLWRYSLLDPSWRAPEIQAIDFSTMLFGLATLPEHLGNDFFYFRRYNHYAHVDNESPETNLPGTFALHQNYPNPFRDRTTIQIDLPVNAEVTLLVYDLLGKEMDVIIRDKMMNAGIHSLKWEASGVRSGVYYLRLESNGVSQMKQMVVVR